MFFRAVTTPLMTPVPNFNKWCAVSNFLFKNIDFCIFTPKTPLVKENYFLTLWNFTYLKDTSFGKKLCNFELGLETKNEFEKWPLYNFVSVYMSRVVRKPDICPCENKGTDQLRSNCEADQRLCFRNTDGTISLRLKSENSSFLPASVSVQVGLC